MINASALLQQPSSGPNSVSKSGALLASFRTWLNGPDSPESFEILNIRTGAPADYPPFHDGTLADRIARTLGRDWRVFATTNPAVLPATVQPQGELRPAEETFTRDLQALCTALEQAAVDPRTTQALPQNVRLDPGRLIINFGTAAELHLTLTSLSNTLMAAEKDAHPVQQAQ